MVEKDTTLTRGVAEVLLGILECRRSMVYEPSAMDIKTLQEVYSGMKLIAKRIGR